MRTWSRVAVALLVIPTFGPSGAAAEADNVVKLTKFNFDTNVKKGSWFVKFYAPWCTHCKKLAPIWEKLADRAAAGDWAVKIAEVDCTVSKEVCEKVQVKAFPTLSFIGDGALRGKYQGEASVAGFEEFITGQLSKDKSKSSPTATSTAKGKPSKTYLEEKPLAEAQSTTHEVSFIAVLGSLLARFPTKHKIANIYIYSCVLLAGLVAFLCLLFRMVEEEDAGREHRD